MPKTTTVTCDACERDLTTTCNCVGYRIAVVNESIPTEGGSVTLMHIVPHLRRSYYFCDLECLLAWAEKIKKPKKE